MHSVILSWIYSLFKCLYSSLEKSRVWKLFNKIYNCVSKNTTQSFTAKKLSEEDNSRFNSSFVYKICRIPFIVVEFLSRIFKNMLSSFCEKSVISALGKSYFNAFCSMNTRFLGSVAFGFGAGYFIIFALSGGLSLKALFLMLAGILLYILNINISDFLSTSKIVGFLQSISDFKDISFDFYDKNKNCGILYLISGLLTGFLMSIVLLKSALLALAVPFLIFGMLLVLIFPVAGIFAAVFLAPFIPTMLLAGLCMFTLFALFCNKTLTPDFKWKVDGLGAALIILLIILFISSVLSFDAKKSLMVFAMYLVFFSFYFVIINSVETKKQLFSILKIFVISGAIVALYGILQYIFRWDTQNAWIDEAMFEEATMRAYSTLENPNVLGEYLLLVLPVAAVFMIKLDIKSLSKWVYAGAFLCLALCLVFTQSRGCWLGFMLSALVFICYYKGKLLALVPLGILLLPFVLPETMLQRFMSVGNMSDSSTSYRVYIWYGTMEMLKTYFVGGIGMGEGAFSQVYPLYSYNAIIAPHSHNLFLQLTVEAGIGALIIFIAAMVVFFKNSVVTCKNYVKNSSEYLMSLALCSGVLGFLLQSMFDYTFYNYRVMSMFIMYIALGSAFKIIQKGDLTK